MGTVILRGGSELTPADFNSLGPQEGGILVQGGKRSGFRRSGFRRKGRRSSGKRRGTKRRGSKRSGSKRRGTKRSRKMRGGNTCGAPLNTTMGGMDMPQMGGMDMPSGMPSSMPGMPSSMSGGMLVSPPSNGGGRTRRLRKMTGKARRHRTKSYSA